MNAKRILVALALALAASAGCTWLFARQLVSRESAHRMVRVQYVAPQAALAPGQVISARDLQLVSWQASSSIEGALRRPEDAIGRQVLFPLAKGAPILQEDLAVPGASVGLASRVANGQRAVALRSDSVVGVAGFLLPGSRVDMLVTYRTDQSPEMRTDTILQNEQVLAVNQQADPSNNSKPADVTIVTLMLNPEEAERAVLASNQGAIHFVLRNGADDEHHDTAPVMISELGRARLEPATHAPVRITLAKAAPAPPREIEVVTGGGSASGGGR